MLNNHAQITAALLELAAIIAPQVLLPALFDDAAELVQSDPFAFSLATCLDRGMNAEVVWTFPYWIREDLGHLDPFRLARMSLDELDAMLRRLPKRPRYINAAPRTIHEISHLVAREYGGKAERIWVGRHAWEVQRIFESIHGVGPGIASMALLLIEKGFGYQFPPEDHRLMDIKPDVHTVRVLHRLGVSDELTEASAIAAARYLHPSFPGAIDGALWHIGRTWCAAQAPDCPACHMRGVCARRLV